MKASSVLNLLSVSAIAIAAPGHVHHLHKKDVKVVTVSEIVTVLDGVTLFPSTSDGTVVTVTVGGPSSSATTSPSVQKQSLAATEKEINIALTPSSTYTPPTTTSSTPTTTVEPEPTTSTSSTPTTTSTPTTSSSSSSSAAATTTSSSSSGLSEFAQKILDQHNKYRALHGAPDLEWSDTLASYASDYVVKSNTCANDNLVHSGGEYGENLAIGYGFTGTVDAWYNEIDDYDFSNPGFSSATGHFTQVIWKSSTKLGCAYQYCDSEWSNYVVCEYDPAGNVGGEYASNVLS